MNILVSSTRQWNPGDEFILMGVRNLLREVLKGHRINWVLYDRNPDLFIDGFSNPLHKDRIWGNSFHHKDTQCFDLALIAGTPEWMGPPLKGFYRAVKEGSLPLIILGVGYIDAPITFSEDELYCFRNLLKVATVRDEYASRALHKVGISHEILPCPAIFASSHETLPQEIKKIGFIFQTNKTVNQSVPEGLSRTCSHTVKRLRNRGFEVDVVCHYIDEFVEFARTLAPVRYSYNAHDYIDILNDYDLIISTRLHGAILANSLGKPAIVLNSDSRVRGGASLFPFIYTSTPDTVINDVFHIGTKGLKDLIDWKGQIRDRYLFILKNGPITQSRHNYVVGAAILREKMIIPEAIKKILIPRFDTVGDIVLLEGFIEALIEKFPNAEITLLVREGYKQLAPLFPKKLIWMTAPLNPYKGLEENDFEDLSEFLEKIAKSSWDLLLTTTYSRTWLDDLVAAKLGGVTRIALGKEVEIAGWVERLFSRLDLETEGRYDEVVPVEEDLRETEKYQQFWNELFRDEKKLALPKIVIGEDIEEKAKAIISELGLNDQGFFICAPAGTQNVSIKVWPIQRFGEVISWVNAERKLKALLIGHESEEEVINKLAEMLKRRGIEPYMWLGQDGELPILAALMRRAHFYLGNDAGPMHIAAAVDIPVIGIFGGGTWPRFVPVGPNSIGIAGELPCFGCNWECIFEDAPCMRLVEVEDVKKAIRTIISGEAVKSNILRSSEKISSETAEFIEKALKKFQFLKYVIMDNLMDKLGISEADRAARLEMINKLSVQLQESEVDREARLDQINELTRLLKESEADRAVRLEVIHKLEVLLRETEMDKEAKEKFIERVSGELGIIKSSTAYRLLKKIDMIP